MKLLSVGKPFKPRGSAGWTLVLIERAGDVAIAEKTHPDVTRKAYEVAHIQRHGAYEIGGQRIEAGETWPSSESFGALAWAPATLEAARVRFAERIDVERAKVAGGAR